MQERSCTKVASVACGEYYHFGIQQGIVKTFSHRGCTGDVAVELQVNVGGLSVFKSSNPQLWPILGRIHNNTELVGSSVRDSPFVIAIFQGKQKPSDVEKYLEEFVKEAKTLEVTGISHSNCCHPLKISAVICVYPVIK